MDNYLSLKLMQELSYKYLVLQTPAVRIIMPIRDYRISNAIRRVAVAELFISNAANKVVTLTIR